MSETTDLPPQQDSKTVPRQGKYGILAILLWGLAAVCSGVDALLAYDRVRVLVFTGGLLMMDIAGAVLLSLIWFLSRHFLGPLATYQAGLEYGFRAGQISRRNAQADLHVVVPMPSQRPANGYHPAATGTDRGRERPS